MNIADLIAALQRGEDPNQAIPAQFVPGADDPSSAAMPPGIRPEFLQGGVMPPIPPAAPAGQDAQAQAPRPPAGPPPAPPPSPPQGVATPITNPQPPGQAPTITQSPPDLSNMYLQLIQKNQNAQALDSGLSLIAAGLTPHAATRQALIQHSTAAGRGGQNVTAADLIGLQKQAQATKDMALRRSMLAGLAKQYNLSPEAAFTLESSGKLDELIKELESKGLTVHEDSATGQKAFYDRNGNPIVKLGGPKPEQGEFVTGPQGPELRSKITGAQVAPGIGQPPTESTRTDQATLDIINSQRPPGKPPMTMEELILLKKPAGTNVYVSPDGTQFTKPPEGYEYERYSEGPNVGKVKIGPDGRPIMYSASPKAVGEQIETAQDISDKEKKAADLLKKEHKERVAAKFASTNVGEAVDTALGLADSPGATGTFASWGRNLSPFKGQAWNTLDAKLKTIDANNVVSALNAMRAASPSGGALGNVTEQENKMLASIIASTDPNQDTKEFKKSLIRIKAAMMVMAENKYDDKDGEGRFTKDLKERVDDLTAQAVNKSGSRVTITPRAKQ